MYSNYCGGYVYLKMSVLILIRIVHQIVIMRMRVSQNLIQLELVAILSFMYVENDSDVRIHFSHRNFLH